MRLSILCAAALLAVGSVGVASAAIVTDGSFADTSGMTSLDPSTGGYTSLTAYTNQQVGWDGFALTHWTAHGYTMQYGSVADATGASACGYTQYHTPTSAPNGNGGGPCSTLNAVGPLLPDGSRTTSFIAMDGISGTLQGSVAQTLSGLTQGASYTVKFYWGTTQEAQASSTVQSHEMNLTVGFGGDSQTTNPDVTTDWGHFEGWFSGSFTFTADSANPLLSFLASGNPSDGPPMILLTGVSVTQNVPEPPELAMFGLGLLGLGLLTVFARRRALRRQA